MHATDITVAFVPDSYMFPGGSGENMLILEVSGLGSGVLECEVDVNIVYNDGPKAS